MLWWCSWTSKVPFDTATFTAIQEALEKHNVVEAMIKWIVNTLSCMSVHLIYQDSNVEPKSAKGCPQRGVLFSFLWYVVVDSLLQQLNAKGYPIQGYADDLTMGMGKHQNNVAEPTFHYTNLDPAW